MRPESEEDWARLWESYLYKGSMMLALEHLAKKIGISLEDLKHRIESKSEREWQRDFRKGS